MCKMCRKKYKIKLDTHRFQRLCYYTRSWGEADRTMLYIRLREGKINYFVVFSLGTQEF